MGIVLKKSLYFRLFCDLKMLSLSELNFLLICCHLSFFPKLKKPYNKSREFIRNILTKSWISSAYYTCKTGRWSRAVPLIVLKYSWNDFVCRIVVAKNNFASGNKVLGHFDCCKDRLQLTYFYLLLLKLRAWLLFF